MTDLLTQLTTRSSRKCEICSSAQDLETFEVTPNSGVNEHTAVVACKICVDFLSHGKPVEISHWYALAENIWSEFVPVKVVAYRVLKRLGDDPWATDLLGQLYLDEHDQAWADTDTGFVQQKESDTPTVDSNGTPIKDGDTVTLIKDLDVKGANFTAKRGTTVKGISLTDDPRYIEGRVNGIRIVLVAAYLKKAT